jgi:ribosomal protein L7/L12
MANYQVARSSEWDHDGLFDLTVTGIKRKDLEKLTVLANRAVVGEEEPVAYPPSTFRTLAQLDYTQKVALIEAARLHYKYGVKCNRIDTIKFVRSLTNMGLLDSKNVVDYATNDGFMEAPEWLTAA